MDDCGAKRTWMTVSLKTHSYIVDYRLVALWCFEHTPYLADEGEGVVCVVHRSMKPLVDMDVASCLKK